MAANVSHSSAFLGDEVGEPALDVAPAEAQVLADPEASRSGVAMSPCVDRTHRDFKIHGKVLSGQETLGAAQRLWFVVEWELLLIAQRHGIIDRITAFRTIQPLTNHQDLPWQFLYIFPDSHQHFS